MFFLHFSLFKNNICNQITTSMISQISYTLKVIHFLRDLFILLIFYHKKVAHFYLVVGTYLFFLFRNFNTIPIYMKV